MSCSWYIPSCFPESSRRSPLIGSRAGIFSCERIDQEGTTEEGVDVPGAPSMFDESLSSLFPGQTKWTRELSLKFPEQERFSRGVWQLIQSSPKLMRLDLNPQTGDDIWFPNLMDNGCGGSDVAGGPHFMDPTTDSTPPSPTLQTPGALFLALVLRAQKNLFHFQPSLNLREEIVLEVMAQEQRWGCSSIHSYSSMNSHFALPSDRVTWNLIRDRLLNPRMRHLTLGSHHTTVSRVRFFLEIFPNLEELHLISVIEDTTAKAMEDEILVNTSIRKFSIRKKAPGLALCRVQFDGLKEFEALRLGHKIWDLVPLLRWSMPRCEVFRVGVSDSWRHTVPVLASSIPSDIQALERCLSSSKERELPVRKLALRLKRFQPIPEIVGAIQWMPFLTSVEFRGNLGAEVLELLAQHRPKLQRLKVTKMLGRSSRALCLLLRSCKDLKSVQGPHLVLRAVDVISSQPWVCSGMQEFSCRILGVPRLTAGEEMELSQSDMGLEEVRLEEAAERAKWEQDVGGVVGSGKGEGAIKRDQEKDEPTLQRKKRVTQICRRRKLLMHQQRSRELQHQIFSVLAKWAELEVLDLGYYMTDYKKDWIYRSRPYTLEWSFDSGVGQLATLKKLVAVYVHKFEHRVGDGERQWMSDNWPRLRAGSLMGRP